MTGDIFIQLASYRDPQLISTMRDAVERARDSSRLHFCVAWQHGDDESRDDLVSSLPGDVKLTLLDIDHRESRGACWARHQIQQHYNGEAYTLQLDSHHRFADGWDEICIGMIEELRADGVRKPLLTAYLPSFNPDDDPKSRVDVPWFLAFDRFIPEGAVFFTPTPIPNWRERSRPMRSRFYSAHFAFTLGSFARDVQHNPEYYFHGEEISIAARAFTHGYDLFSPHRLIAWHEYTRRGRAKHWDDHTDWGSANVSSHDQNRTLFGMDEYAERPHVVANAQTGRYGFGKCRTLEDFERYAGVCFRRRGVTQAVLEGQEPSPSDNTNVPYDEFARGCIRRFKHCIDVSYDRVPLEDYDFWCVAFKDAKGDDLFVQNAGEDEIARMRKDPDGYCKVWRQFDTEVQPKTWMVWPHSRAHGWCPPIIGSLG